ncbi:hypothetical protein [Mycolicibacterium arenosum]|uniref:Uncharacterized protein n=1 Tax=Mycolicibacterium arenosum TaxID=2952157 RepID=A0ABT1M4H1_9MYCO|nr:hypothetical protein [Mycolicibacterium sp. CAU 1645]MCP9274060.1 hypothetical protein [Mycolicibacterium sp. CAU 1645]
MNYLRGNATASAVGLYVICRYLSNFADGLSIAELQKALEMLRSLDSAKTAKSAVLTASLNVGEGLDLLVQDKQSSIWTVDARIAAEMRTDADQWLWFRGELAHRMMQHALSNSEGTVPDLVLGLTWFLQTNPLSPLQTAWRPTEKVVRDLGLEAVARSEQWLPFQRWALALGFARRSDQPSARVLIPDVSTAISDQLRHLPQSSSAREWVDAMQKRLPVTGVTALTDNLPQGGDGWSPLPQSVMLGLLKLETAGALTLDPSDDARDVVAIGLGATSKQVGRISVRRVA